MNYPKPWLSINNEISFLEHLVKLYYNSGIRNIVVVLNNECYSSKWGEQIRNIEQYCFVVKNNQVDNGRLYSIKLGLEQLDNTNFVYIQNIDNPFIDTKVINTLRQNSYPNGVTIPTYNGKGGHPVLISKKIKERILKHYNSSDTLRDVLDRFDRKNVEVESDSILLNINTPSEYKKVLSEFI